MQLKRQAWGASTLQPAPKGLCKNMAKMRGVMCTCVCCGCVRVGVWCWLCVCMWCGTVCRCVQVRGVYGCVVGACVGVWRMGVCDVCMCVVCNICVHGLVCVWCGVRVCGGCMCVWRVAVCMYVCAVVCALSLENAHPVFPPP